MKSIKLPAFFSAFALIFVGALIAIFSDQDTPGLNVPGEFPTIESALAQAQPKDVIIVDAEQGPYRENLEIKVPGIEIKSSNGRAVIEAKVAEKDVVRILADNVKFSGFDIRRGATGILVESTFGVAIEDNHIQDQFGIGIMLFEAKHGQIGNNVIRGNIHGIWLSHESDDNILVGNLVEKNVSVGLSLNVSNNNRITQNQWLDHQTGINISQSVTNTLSDNQINHNQTGLSINEAAGSNQFFDNEIKGNSTGISLFNTHQNVFERNQISENLLEGVVAEVTSETEYRDNVIKDNQVGIRFVNSSTNTVQHNTIEANQTGVHLAGSSLNNVIQNNNIFANTSLGLSNDTLELAHAENNYWGDTSGARFSKDDVGDGDLVAGLVEFTPWLAELVVLNAE